MSLETSLANIVIRDNTFDQGRFSDGATPVTYNYDYHAWTFGSSIIEGNTFLAPDESTDILNIDNCSCIIIGNKFVRNGTTINSYIRNYGSNDQMIRSNMFDSPTVDGSSETLVVGLTASSTYDNNKNQTSFMSVYPTRDMVSTNWYDGTTSGIVHYLQAHQQTVVYDYYFSTGTIATNFASGIAINVTFFVNLSRLLPKNTRVLGSLVGFRYNSVAANISTTLNGCTIQSEIRKTAAARPINTAFTSPTSTLAAITGSPTNLDSALGNTTTTFTADTTARSVAGDYTALSIYTNETQDIIFLFRNTFVTTSSTATSTYRISPMLFKYRWE